MSQLSDYLGALQRFGIRPGLERIEALLAAAGNPEKLYPLVLVGGTNGKGSTCEFLARNLSGDSRVRGELAKTRRIGLYTSPHIYAWNERIRVLPGEGRFEGTISDHDLDGLFRDAQPIISNVADNLGQPTEFEVITFLGLWHFARAGVDAAVIEVGLGGHWDATNVTEPVVSVVTHVALDHCDRLGNTVEEIAEDKVHIARSGRPFLTAERRPSVIRVFQNYCARIGAVYAPVAVPRHNGDFQLINAATARAAEKAFRAQVGWEPALAKSADQPSRPVPGRFEILERAPNLVIDGANNPDGANRLAALIRTEQAVPRERLILVLGILEDKDYAGMTQILAPLARTVIATQSNSPRAAPAESVAKAASAAGAHVEIVRAVPEAVQRARQLAGPEDWILVTGSFTTIGEVPVNAH